jgi:hypothetical protein
MHFELKKSDQPALVKEERKEASATDDKQTTP